MTITEYLSKAKVEVSAFVGVAERFERSFDEAQRALKALEMERDLGKKKELFKKANDIMEKVFPHQDYKRLQEAIKKWEDLTNELWEKL